MRIMRLKEVMDTTGLGRSYIYKLIAVSYTHLTLPTKA